ncbi:hypothetical protein BD309DRAFT_962926 [Dichomitus squalens]|uniref:Uncharacterized protein n=1 Tax=Dichomitus squalens TaxID=114155 RepID=A0A4Q9NSQ1_9APHY|nr:hypothetical protein BD311DRAFT_763219 [Dichomitus squalens]TBU42456.1 hypothetical protein BD309DRAFT_962926 [Dichomitus squalens]
MLLAGICSSYWLIHDHHAMRTEVSAARRWSAHLVAVDVRAAFHSGSSSSLPSTAGEYRRANAFSIKSSVRDGRLGLCGVDASHCKAEPLTVYAGLWECGCTTFEVSLQLSLC